MPHPDPELIIGVVTPIGSNTSELVQNLANALSSYTYTPIVLKLSASLPSEAPPLAEPEDARVRRLIAAGDEFCRQHTAEHADGDPASLARLAVRDIVRARVILHRQAGDERAADALAVEARPRTAYILHSLKRPAEVKLLREVYGQQFVLVGSQTSAQQRRDRLMAQPMTESDPARKTEIVNELMRLDSNEGDPVGQKVNDTYPFSDFFLRDSDVTRTVELLFGEPLAPDIGEYAMYMARASAARSLAASRKVGAAIVVDESVVSTGYNDVPHGQTPDVKAGADTSEAMKRANVLDTMLRLKDAGLLDAGAASAPDDELAAKAVAALQGGELMSVIEYQRAVHAEARAIDDATIRGVSPRGGVLYVTTFPCHLCYKHTLSVRLERVEYIDPYPKSRAAVLYPIGSEQRLVPYAGTAPRRYIEIFEERPAFKADDSGEFPPVDRRAAQPLLGQVSEDADRWERERWALTALKEEYQ